MSGRSDWDTIVVGAGVFGAWTAWRLRQSGQKVLLLDASGPANARASSGGESRLTRTIYGADDVYTRMAWDSLEDWRWLSSRAGLPILHSIGVLMFFGKREPFVDQSIEAHRRLGQNYADLAVVLWEELMQTVEDRKLRRVLFGRVTERLAELYRTQVTGEGWEGRLVQLGSILHDRGIEAEVTWGSEGGQPVLKQHSCPYYELAEVDHSICALERKMFEKVLGRSLRLSQCRLDGHRSCDFEAKPIMVPPPAKAV